jgi:DNA processing protein
MLNKNTELLLHLSLAEKIGPATVYKILHRLLLDQNPNLLDPDWSDIAKNVINLDLSVIYDYLVSDFITKSGLSVNCAQQVYSSLSDHQILDRELVLAEKNNIKIVDILSSDYPEILRQIHFPPVVLYISGVDIDQKSKHFGIVGSRNADTYAFDVIQNIVPTLISNKWVIVSGGANGADTMAHRTTLNQGGRTVVVLGSGILCPYPANNIDLFKTIVDSGSTIISPFPLNRQPDRGTFPARNRIISGLSMGCLVVQAALKSGALITARCALEQGRLVFAVPGKVDDKLSAGCNELIKQGAKLVCSANDILEEFGEYLQDGYMQAEPISADHMSGENRPTKTFKPARKIEHQVDILGAGSGQCDDVVLCSIDKICTLDELLAKTGLNFDELQDRLFNLQLEGKIKQNFSGAWEKI